jgi:hypothetical protein
MVRHIGIIMTMVLLITASSVGCISNPTARESWTIEPGDDYSMNNKIKRGAEVSWNWNSNRILEFNLTQGGTLHMFSANNTREEEGKFTSEGGNYYIFLWTNHGSRPVKLEYEIEYDMP